MPIGQWLDNTWGSLFGGPGAPGSSTYGPPSSMAPDTSLAGLLDPRGIREQAAWAGLGALSQGLLAAGMRRPAASPSPLPQALGAFQPAYAQGIQSGTQMAALEEQARRQRAFQGLVEGMPAGTQRQMIEAAGPSALGPLIQAQARPRATRMNATEEQHYYGETGLGGYFDEHGAPRLPQGPRQEAALERARVSQRPIVGGGFTGVLPPGYFPGAAPAQPPSVAPPTTAPPAATGGAARPPQAAAPPQAAPRQGPFTAADFSDMAPAEAEQAAARANDQWRIGQDLNARRQIPAPPPVAVVPPAPRGTTPPRPAPTPPATAVPPPQGGVPGVTGGPAAYSSGFTRGPRGELLPSQPPATSPEGSQDAIVGRVLGDQFKTIQEAGTAARATLTQLDRIQALSREVQAGGPAAPLMTRIRAMAQQAGIQIGENVAPEQALQAVANEFALQLRNPAGGAGMPGAMSDPDREFLASMTPSLTVSPQGRELIIDMRRRMATRDQEVATFTRGYMRQHGGRLDLNFDDALTQHFASRPLFGEEFRNRIAEITGGARPAATGSGGTAPPAAAAPPSAAAPPASARPRAPRPITPSVLPPGIPAGSTLQGTSNGNPVYLTPDGRRLMVQP